MIAKHSAVHLYGGVKMAIFAMCTAAGPPDNDGTAPSARSGKLWELYKQLQDDGWSLDAISYTTNFRLNAMITE